jgi:hypothetical protein
MREALGWALLGLLAIAALATPFITLLWLGVPVQL